MAFQALRSGLDHKMQGTDASFGLIAGQSPAQQCRFSDVGLGGQSHLGHRLKTLQHSGGDDASDARQLDRLAVGRRGSPVSGRFLRVPDTIGRLGHGLLNVLDEDSALGSGPWHLGQVNPVLPGKATGGGHHWHTAVGRCRRCLRSGPDTVLHVLDQYPALGPAAANLSQIDVVVSGQATGRRHHLYLEAGCAGCNH